MSTTTSSPWANGKVSRSGPFPRRSIEIGAIVVSFIYWWPVGLALVAWKIAGYPALGELRDYARRGAAGWEGGTARASRFARSFEATNRRNATGNWAFEEYRKAELDRLDAQRRALQEESRAFAAFVEELKRAKDRDQFDAFMAKRRAEGAEQSFTA